MKSEHWRPLIKRTWSLRLLRFGTIGNPRRGDLFALASPCSRFVVDPQGYVEGYLSNHVLICSPHLCELRRLLAQYESESREEKEFKRLFYVRFCAVRSSPSRTFLAHCQLCLYWIRWARVHVEHINKVSHENDGIRTANALIFYLRTCA
jgi:hypothetical protein